MDKDISADEAARDFSHVLEGVRGGESYTITAEGRPVALVVPVPVVDEEAQERAWRALIDHLRSQPALNLGIKWTRDELYDDE